MSRYIDLMERADRAMHDVAQLHLTEFLDDRRPRDPIDKWGAIARSGGRSSASDPKGRKLETTEERGLNRVNPTNAD
jgi:hypothetical protein